LIRLVGGFGRLGLNSFCISRGIILLFLGDGYLGDKLLLLLSFSSDESFSDQTLDTAFDCNAFSN